MSGWTARARSAAALGLLALALPANLALTAGAALTGRAVVPERPARPRTVLLSGGKMTKALTLARAFHAAGHRVVLVESAAYRFTGHRFSRAVAAFHVVPEPGDPGYAAALREVVRAEGVDVYVPVCSPVSAAADAAARALLDDCCEVLHPDPATLATLDDKDRFAAAAAALGLGVPDTHRVTDPTQVAAFDFPAHGPPYVLKSIAYDPVHRLDLTPLPRATAAATAAHAASKPISPDNPWILQALAPGREYCTHAVAREGRILLWACCASSSFQVNYVALDHPAIEAWARRLVGALGVTGQVSFDVFVEGGGDGGADGGGDGDGRGHGTVRAIECNPRTHSAVTLFAGHPDLARAYLDGLDADEPPVRPRPDARGTYWAYHEAWRALSRPWQAPARLAVVLRGRDAIFDRADPWPFLLVHHLQIPLLLLRRLVTGGDWVRVDFNIGKLVEPAGD